MWQNNLLKFYLEHDLEKALDFGQDLLQDVAPLLAEPFVQDLKFTLATAQSMKAEDLDTAITLYQESLYSGEKLTQYPQLNDLRGIVYNNLGITHFYKFIELSNAVDSSDPTRLSPELVKPIVENMNSGINYLKNSVRELEKIEARIKALEDASSEVTLQDLETKMLFEDFFNPEILDIVKPNFGSYDLMKNAKNEQFLKTAFKNPPSILPIQNLGEIAFIL